MLVETGCGSHVFPKNFDEHVMDSSGSSISLPTVMGEKLELGAKKKSWLCLQRTTSPLCLDYTEVENIEFPILSAGSASSKGLWMVVGQGCQCLIHGSIGKKFKETLQSCQGKTLLRLRQPEGGIRNPRRKRVPATMRWMSAHRHSFQVMVSQLHRRKGHRRLASEKKDKRI